MNNINNYEPEPFKWEKKDGHIRYFFKTSDECTKFYEKMRKSVICHVVKLSKTENILEF